MARCVSLAEHSSFSPTLGRAETVPTLPTVQGQKHSKTFSKWDSHVVTHRSTSHSVCSLSTGEQTGPSIFCNLWPNVEDRESRMNIYCVVSPLPLFPTSGVAWGFNLANSYHDHNTFSHSDNRVIYDGDALHQTQILTIKM
jgi:hypothetical protein